MSTQEFVPGDTVFAKLRGYPWWPARVENDKEIPAQVLKRKSKSKGAVYTVLFYGTKDYGFFGPDSLRPFEREKVDGEFKAKKYKTKALEHAIHQALDPSFIEEEKIKEDARMKKRLSMEVDMDDAKRYKGLPVKGETKKDSTVNMETFKETAAFKRVYRIRHKLQRLVYEKEPGGIPKEDYARISEIVKEIKNLPMTVDLIKHTKIARVLNYASNYCFDGDEFDINQNCSQLLKSWQNIIDDYHC